MRRYNDSSLPLRLWLITGDVAEGTHKFYRNMKKKNQNAQKLPFLFWLDQAIVDKSFFIFLQEAEPHFLYLYG
jgi:hypothetical protein